MGEGNAKVQITVKVARSVSVIGQGNVGAAEYSREGNEGIVEDEEDVFFEMRNEERGMRMGMKMVTDKGNVEEKIRKT